MVAWQENRGFRMNFRKIAPRIDNDTMTPTTHSSALKNS